MTARLPIASPERIGAELAGLAPPARPGARLEFRWSATLLSERPTRRVVRFDAWFGHERAPAAGPFRWVGKFYGMDGEAESVARHLEGLAACGPALRRRVAVPRVARVVADLRLLLTKYEPGAPLAGALAARPAPAITAVARALAALHGSPAPADEPRHVPLPVLEDVRHRVENLAALLPARESEAATGVLAWLERNRPGAPARVELVHGDCGPAQMLWQQSRVCLLDFDKCGAGDGALDLGNFLAQLRRLVLSGRLPAARLADLRRRLIDEYQLEASPSADLPVRVLWYERAALLRKAQFLAVTSGAGGGPPPAALLHAAAQCDESGGEVS